MIIRIRSCGRTNFKFLEDGVWKSAVVGAIVQLHDGFYIIKKVTKRRCKLKKFVGEK